MPWVTVPARTVRAGPSICTASLSYLHGFVVFMISVSPASVASVTVGPSVAVVTIIIVIVVGGERGGAVIVDEKGRAG